MTKSATAKPVDAIALLIEDHNEVKSKFDAYDKLGDRAHVAKKKLVDEICLALTVHMGAEEEIFYPAVEGIDKKEKELVDEATVEHAGAKDLIAQLQSMEPGDDLYDAKVKVLSEQIEHHVKEEEEEMFPNARKAKLDLVALGEAIAQYKQQALETAA
jgi:hemerythrin-like domain-containing protein